MKLQLISSPDTERERGENDQISETKQPIEPDLDFVARASD
jgi:hypothetical protein